MQCLTDTRSSFISVRLHPGSVPSIYIHLHDTNTNFIPERVTPERVHPGNSGSRSGGTFHKYHAKEVRAHSGMELGTWTGWADQC